MEGTDARHEAIRRYLAGQRPAEICRALGYSKPWLYKWLKRYDPTNASWAQNDSRAPQRLTTKTPAELERNLCESASTGRLAAEPMRRPLGLLLM